jgi:hypothetical protein
MGRKEAIQEYKARKVARGVFAVRCTATGQVWVDSSGNLDAARNSVWFFLRHRYHQNKSLQAEWDAHGKEAFLYEILEQLDEDVSAIGVSDLLRERRRHWVVQLGAQALSP